VAQENYEGVKKLLKKKLITGMTLDSSVAPDPICEPCLAGKMHANPFPPSEWRASSEKCISAITTICNSFLS